MIVDNSSVAGYLQMYTRRKVNFRSVKVNKEKETMKQGKTMNNNTTVWAVQGLQTSMSSRLTELQCE